MKFSVNYWGSHPELGNDDCYTGRDYTTAEEAREAFERLPSKVIPFDLTDCEYIELDGPGVYEVRENPEFDRKANHDDDDWRREMAREAGMLHGAAGYNEAMGY